MLKRITSNDPVQRFYVALHESTLSLLQAYRDNYQSVYGDELPQNLAIETMLLEFMEADKDFQKYRKTQAKERKEPARTSAPQAEPQDSGRPEQGPSELDSGQGLY
ncbi:hypothetical protein A6M27_17125 [Acidithiobacillus thiooxidans]|uniref:Uncharacterized protein n=1 Tax=Acidithiobacillus thiooxidans TaxID=930 RepID=A0A1C2J6E2_ACITH|nr:DUF2274 domain-containing protein [Acidithiobacillus thiooxidans]OCX68166.1 hypothetical protein A6O24_19965 [Acidithiobacillus thiooxidans]OCX70706.1 hypothetical protein A6P07_13680 [Acidithiobacillus thiooxidans]OCX83473.1 hypothetical protein A6O26_07015 [Acidithiobacillus thiooxidans]OCX83817.1 hypothetical protein A6M27_17125 [Acidithiobacillus thiooxidans]OFC50303.1 hypothetical protein BAE47_03110 [Acidithiobacillus thiooxidans]